MKRVKRWPFLLLSPAALLSLLSAGSSGPALTGANSNTIRVLRRSPTREGPKYVPGQVRVRFRPGVKKDFMTFAHQAVGAEVVKRSRLVDRLQQVQIPDTLSVEEAIGRYLENPDVLYAEPNYIVHLHSTPNDPSFSQQWSLHNTGQDGGVADADIDAPEAWDLAIGNSAVVVAVLDTGIDYNHPDLAANAFPNEPDCNTNKVDDDGNGYVDDCFGIDPIGNDSDPLDDHGHGTHVSGIIGAVGNNAAGLAGVSWNVKILSDRLPRRGRDQPGSR